MRKDVMARVQLALQMDEYVRDIIGDEEWEDYWNIYGVPDGCTDYEALADYFGDERTFAELCEEFNYICTQVVSDTGR